MSDGPVSLAARQLGTPERGGSDQAVDVVVIGGGPAGLSAGLQLVRANLRVAILDSNRPRHAATLHSHGFLTRDGAPPLELRRLGREEFSAYPGAVFAQAAVRSITPLSDGEAAAEGFPDGIGYRVEAAGIRGSDDVDLRARRVIVASGLTEELPALPSIRAYYGTALHSCIACDGFEKSDQPLALIGETEDLLERALLISRFASDLVVFTNGSDALDAEEERRLAEWGIGVERRPIDDVVGERAAMTGVRLDDGEIVPRTAGFVRPVWRAAAEYLGALPIDRDDHGLIVVDARGATGARGVYAVGDVVPPGPQQLIIAAGDGARVAAQVNLDLLLGAA